MTTSKNSTSKRVPANVLISDKCPHCGKRLWSLEDKGDTSRHYHPPRWLGAMFKQSIGAYLLGEYFLDRCEVCGKTVAVFNQNKGVFTDVVVVLYSCSLLSCPVDSDICESMCKGCYACPAKGLDGWVQKY